MFMVKINPKIMLSFKYNFQSIDKQLLIHIFQAYLL